MKTKTKKKRLDDDHKTHVNLHAILSEQIAKGLYKEQQTATQPEPGTKRIVWENGRYFIEEYSKGGYDPSYSVAIRYWNAGWEPRHEARTLWGIKRLWRKLYGTETPFPSLKLVYGEAGK